jgi:hypothetical protein
MNTFIKRQIASFLAMTIKKRFDHLVRHCEALSGYCAKSAVAISFYEAQKTYEH